MHIAIPEYSLDSPPKTDPRLPTPAELIQLFCDQQKIPNGAKRL
jgi:hypothetical protein